MSSSRRRADAALEELYAEVPDMADCRGLCHDSCGPLLMTTRERQRADIAGVEIPTAEQGLIAIGQDPGWRCPALGPDNRCTIYAVRSLICRLYGTVEDMRCPHGCVPVGGFRSSAWASDLISRVVAIGGQPA